MIRKIQFLLGFLMIATGCAVIDLKPYDIFDDSLVQGPKLTVEIMNIGKNGIVIVPIPILEAVFKLTDPDAVVQTVVWNPSNSTVFHFNRTRPGLHSFELTEIDATNTTNRLFTNYTFSSGHNYRIKVYLGGGFELVETTPEAEYNPGPGWILVWNDEFNGPVLDTTSWVYDIGTGPNGDGWGNNELEYYTDRTNNVRIQDGKLVITARQESFGGRSYTSGRIKTKDRQSWTYGKVVARIKMPYGKGLWPAFWMLGTNFNNANWPACGEMDIAEMVGGPAASNSTVYGCLFWTNSGTVSYQRFTNIGAPLSGGFHTYELEWNSAWVKVRIDQKDYFFYDIGSPLYDLFRKPFFILLNVAVGGLWPGSPDGTTVWPQEMTVDWVRVYQRDPSMPALNMSYPQDGVTLYGAFPLRGAAEGSNAIEGIYLSLDGGAFVKITNTNQMHHVLNLSSGLHRVELFAKDVSNRTSITNGMDVTVTWQKPVITFTSMPPEGSSARVFGSVSGVSPSMYKVSLQIFAYWLGWWIKPTSAMPFTPIDADGSWNSLYVSGGVDSSARAMKAYLVPSWVDITTNMLSNAAACVFSNRVDNHANTAYVIDPNTEPPYSQKFNDFTNGSTVYTSNGSIGFTGWAVDAGRDGAPNFVLTSLDNGPFTNTNFIGSYYQEWNLTRTFTAGAHVMKVYKKDNGFGIGETNVMNFTVVIDAVKPSVAVTYPANGQLVSGASVTATGTASDTAALKRIVVNWYKWHDFGSGPQWYNFGSPAVTGTSSWSCLLNTTYTGSNLLEVYSEDMAGNKSDLVTNRFVTY